MRSAVARDLGAVEDNAGASDVVARLGGDEFVVLLQDVIDAEEAGGVARKLLSAINEPMIIAGQSCHVTCGIGISIYPADAEDEQPLMKGADTAMYFARQKAATTTSSIPELRGSSRSPDRIQISSRRHARRAAQVFP